MQREPIRKCAYARVSTLADEQEHSLLIQSEYYSNLISKEHDSVFVGIYADQKSGSHTKNRVQFNEMLEKARNGEIDYILTKSIARFARNLVETLKIVRELREHNVVVYFEKENIDTLKSSSDFMLSIYSTVAESELTSMGDNVRWAARKRYKAGSVELASNIYGYTLDENKKLKIVEHEAEIVREVFVRYLNGEGRFKIASALNARRVKRKQTDTMWRSEDILRVLTNEKYTGDALLQKCTYINNVAKKNVGQAPQYYVENNHEAIITREQFELARKIREQRGEKNALSKKWGDSPFKSKLTCAECGKSYLHRKNHRNTPYEKWIWSCGTYLAHGRKFCSGHDIREKDLINEFMSAYNEAIGYQSKQSGLGGINEMMEELLTQERNLMAQKAKGYITQNMYDTEHNELVILIKRMEAEYENLVRKQVGRMPQKRETEFRGELVSYLNKARINGYFIEFAFKNGAIITRSFDNKANRKSTWAKKLGRNT